MSRPLPLRVALIGLGVMGHHHLRRLGRLPGSSVVAIADPRRHQREGVHSAAEWFDDADSMLAAVQPDIVHIVTPAASHFGLARLSLERGAHVYIEKPVVSTAREVSELFDVARAASRLICGGHQTVFQPALLRAEARVAMIGRLLALESYFAFRPWDRTASPADLLLDVLPHAVYPVMRLLPHTSNLRIDHVEVSTDGEAVVRAHAGATRIGIVASMSARPPDHKLTLTGSDGSMCMDYVRGIATTEGGSPDVVSALLQPFNRSWQLTAGAFHAYAGLAVRGEPSHPGLATLIGRFHAAVRRGEPSPVGAEEISGAVCVSEAVAAELRHAQLVRVRASAPLPMRRDGVVLVTGGTGFIGTLVAETLAVAGWRVRVVARRVPAAERRLLGIEYRSVDLSEPVDSSLFDGVHWVVHCAAATSGGAAEHARNSVAATRHVHDACVRSGVRGLIYMSSIAVLRTSRWYRATSINEHTPLERIRDGRGQYVRGKTAAEHELQQLVQESGLPCRILRPGAVIDAERFEPPGCLGRELAGAFFAVGPRSSPVATCDVRLLARVVAHYLDAFDRVPPLLNVIDPEQPTRGDLLLEIARRRPGLRIVRIPTPIVLLLSGAVSLVQKILSPRSQPLELHSAFYLDPYDSSLTRTVAEGMPAEPPAEARTQPVGAS